MEHLSPESQFAVLNTKLDQILTNDKDHEIRIRVLERWVWLATGAAATVGSAVGSALTQFVK